MKHIPITLPTGLCLIAACEVYDGSFDLIQLLSGTERPVSYAAVARFTGLSVDRVIEYTHEAIQDSLDADNENVPYERADIMRDYYINE